MADYNEKIAFNPDGGLNYDDDPLIIEMLDYVGAKNCYVGPTIGSKRGKMEGMKTLQKILHDLNEDGVCIGAGKWVEKSAIVYALYREMADDAIKVYFPGSGQTVTLFQSSQLNFSLLFRIGWNGIKVLNNKAYWVDGLNEPRELTLLRSLNGVGNIHNDYLYSSLVIGDLSFIKTPPAYAPEFLGMFDDLSVPFNNIVDKRFQFMTVYQYLDGEESVPSPYSQDVFITTGTTYNTVALKLNTGSHMVSRIIVYYRETTNGDLNNYFKTEVINKYDSSGALRLDDRGEQIVNNGEFIYDFNKFDIATTASSLRLQTPFHLVPRKANSLDLLGSDSLRVVMAGYLEGFDYVEASDEQLSVTWGIIEKDYLGSGYLSEMTSGFLPASTFPIKRKNGDFIGPDHELQFVTENKWRFRWNDVPILTQKYITLNLTSYSSIEHRINEIPVPTSFAGISLNFYLVVNNVVTQLDAVITSGLQFVGTIENLVQSATGRSDLTHTIIYDSETIPEFIMVETGVGLVIDLFIESLVYNVTTEFRDTSPFKYQALKIYKVGILFLDEDKRSGSVTTNDSCLVETGSDSGTKVVMLQATIKNLIPPVWAKYWRFVRTDGFDPTADFAGRFYEIGQVYDIRFWGTDNRVMRVFDRPPNNTNSEYSNNHYIEAFVLGGDQDFAGNVVDGKGLIHQHVPDLPGEVWLGGGITVGGVLLDNERINRVNEILGDITRLAREDFGDIKRIVNVGDTLKVYQENKASSIYINKELMFSGSGSNIVYKDQILGKINYREENWGATIPGSVLKIHRSVYGIDLEKAVIFRDSANGMFDISLYKFKTKIREIANYINANTLTKQTYSCSSGFHPKTNQYWFSFTSTHTWLGLGDGVVLFGNIAYNTNRFVSGLNIGDSVVISNEDSSLTVSTLIGGVSEIGESQLILSFQLNLLTSEQQDFLIDNDIPKFVKIDSPDKAWTYAFNEDGNRWDAEMDFNPEEFAELDDFMYSFDKGLIYKHDSPTEITYQNFYGVHHPASVEIVLNENATENKVFNALKIQGIGDFSCPSIIIMPNDTYKSGMRSRIPQKLLKLVEGFYQARFLRDMNSPGGKSDDVNLVNGRELRGSVAKVVIESSRTIGPTEIATIVCEESVSPI